MKRKVWFYTVFAMSVLGCSTYEIKEVCKEVDKDYTFVGEELQHGYYTCVMIKEKK
jgi:hypothetical protein